MRCLFRSLPLLPLLMSFPAAAEVVVGYLTGPDNIPVTGATLVLSSGANGPAYATQTDAQGFFMFPEVKSGRRYVLAAEAEGYAPLRMDAFQLEEKARTRLSLRMQPTQGGWIQQVQLRSQPPLSALGMQTLSPSVATLLLSRPTVEGLFERLPGAHQEVALPNYTREPWRAPAIHGATGLEQEYRMDGIDLSDPFTGRLAFSFPLSFFQTFEAAHAGLSALDTGNTGTLLSLQTRQGGNRLSGDAFLYGLSQPVPSSPQLEYESADRAVLQREDWPLFEGQLSATLGGFLLRDRLWYFGGVAPSGALDRLQSCLTLAQQTSQGCVASLSSSGYGYGYELPALLRVTFNPTPDQSLQASGYGSYGEARGYAPPTSDGLTRVSGDASAVLGQRKTQNYAGSVRYQLRLPTLRTRAQLQVSSVWMDRDQSPNPLDADIDGLPEGELRATRYLIPYELEDTDCQGEPCTLLGYTTGGAGTLFRRRVWRNEARLDVQQTLPELLGTHRLRWGGAFRNEKLTQTQRLTGGALMYVTEQDGQVFQVVDTLKTFDGIKTTEAVESSAQLQRRHVGVEDTWGLVDGLDLRGGLRLEQVLLVDRALQSTVLPTALGLQVGGRYEFGIGQLRSTLSFSGSRRNSAPPLTWLEALYLSPEHSRGFSQLELEAPTQGLSLAPVAKPSSRYEVDAEAKLAGVQELMAGWRQTLPAGLELKLLALSRTQKSALEFLAQPDGTIILSNPAAAALGEDCFQTAEGSTAAGASLCFARPSRTYRALEFSLSGGQLDTDRFYLQAGYVLSQLEGAYPGPLLHAVGQDPVSVSTQYAWVNQGTGAESSNLLGPLPFDRTHRFQLTLQLQLLRGLSVGVEGTLRSGMPLEALAPAADSEAGLIYLSERGAGGRTAWILEERTGLRFQQKLGEAGLLSLSLSVLNPWVDAAAVRLDTRALLTPALPGQDAELFLSPPSQGCWDGSGYNGTCTASTQYLATLETVRPRQLQVQLRYSF